MKSIKLSAIAVCLGVLLSCVGLSFAPPAAALTPIKLSHLTYEDCPPELAEGMVTSGGGSLPANCFLVTGKANNPTGKTVYDADVFGRIYDANGNPVLQNRNRLGSLEAVPPGVSDFQIRISVASNQPTPLKLEKFKASGFSSKVR
ncbi:MAG: hypothetical protein HC890_01825 [Chloroflexaceae bacterium]|nr:hypothetical protein [Chloroflexaceae bacterium]